MLKVDSTTNRRYIQTREFWQDKNNKEMSNLADKMLDLRLSLSRIAQKKRNDFYQCTDGTLKPIQRTGMLKFFKGPDSFEKSFVEYLNNEYKNIKAEMEQTSEKVIKNLIFKK